MPFAMERLVRKAQFGDKEAFIALMESQKLSMSLCPAAHPAPAGLFQNLADPGTDLQLL